MPSSPPPSSDGDSPWQDLASAAQRATADVAQRARVATGQIRERVSAEPAYEGPLAVQALKRYNDAYRTARFVVVVGKVVQVVAVVSFMLALAAAAEAGSQLGEAFAVMGIAMALFYCLLIAVVGILVSAVGQIQLATLDSAVHSSPFLDDEGRARAMRMRV